MDIPTFENKHFLRQNSDILKHIWKVAQGGDSSGSYEEIDELSFPEDDRSQNTLDPNENWDR
jgi:hypothetical protein